MKIFVAASYSAHVDYGTGEVLPEYKQWLEEVLSQIESLGHTVFCALRADKYKINNDDPASAFSLDLQHIKESDALIALLSDKPSAGVQTEVGVAVALNKQVLLAHKPEHELSYFNAAMVKANMAKEVGLPFTVGDLQSAMS